MTASTLIVAITAPEEGSRQLVADMVRTSRHRDLDIVEITPDDHATTGTADISVRYRRQTPLSANSDRLIDLVVTEGGAGASIRRRAAAILHRRLRPTAQKFDRAIWPLTTSADRNRLAAELETLITTYERAYLIYTDAWTMPQAIELAQTVAFDGSGSSELFHVISEIVSERWEESS